MTINNRFHFTKAHLAIAGSALVFAVGAIQFTDLHWFQPMKPPTEVLKKGLVDLGQEKSRKANLKFSINVAGKDPGKKTTALSFSSSFVVHRSGDNFSYDGAGQISSQQKKEKVNYSFLIRSTDGQTFLNLKDAPLKEEDKNLAEKWLSVGKESSYPYSDLIGLFSGFVDDKNIINEIAVGKIENVSGWKARKYEVKIHQDNATKKIEEWSAGKGEQVKGTEQRLAAVMQNFAIDKLNVWVTPYDNKIVKVGIEMTPKKEELKRGQVVASLEMLPVRGNLPKIETPLDVQNMENKQMFQLLSVGLKP